MKKFENLGRMLSKTEQKKISGGKQAYMCSLSFDCYKFIYNTTTHSNDYTKVGTVGCSGSGNCESTSSQVVCPQSDGSQDTASCPPGAYIA